MNYFIDRANEAFGYTDMATERRKADIELDGVEYKKYNSDGGVWEDIHIHSEPGERSIGKPKGSYYTLSTERLDLLSVAEGFDTQEEIARRLCEMCDKNGIFPARILVVGLGNANLTPDTVGVKSALKVHPTLHIYNQEPDVFEELECSEIAVCTPSVLSRTGIDSAEIVKSISKRISPDLIICIDSLMTSSPKRLGCSIQMSTTGIVPGGGIGNKMGAIDYESLGVPVFSIGVPTVINSRVFCNTDMGVSNKRYALGMLVAPREIDEICERAAEIIGSAINQAFGIDTM